MRIFSVYANCCACEILESYKTALSAMKFCQINVIEERWDKFKAQNEEFSNCDIDLQNTFIFPE